MPFSVKILLDSLAPCGARLTTFEIQLPKFCLAQLNTHRMLSKNAASSRAIPTQKIIDQVMLDPVMPIFWGKNQAGMQAAEEVPLDKIEWCKSDWLLARNSAVSYAGMLHRQGVHKQIANRLLEPFMWAHVIVSATTYENFFSLRCDDAAQPEMQWIAKEMRTCYESSRPKFTQVGYFHVPLVDVKDLSLPFKEVLKLSVARCARVSYLTHDGVQDIGKDLELYERLLRDRHLSPFEHCAQALETTEKSGNFTGWRQFRELI